MGELVVTLKNNNGFRGNSNRNRDNAPFRGNRSQITYFTCRQPGYVSYECSTLGTNGNNNPRVFKLENAPHKGESAFSSEIPSVDPIFESFAAKRRKKNNSEAEKVEDPEKKEEKKITCIKGKE
ncbi:hypothetical protein C2G38_2037868 [Gigaspora rosea]|uniref:Uncharacterized protein n=1 Tax=Gigaspora rosea TaxID=44941 RepID=A0A397V435_9GLOM|nr:hypothetical protein C2G38_2037868 [Gigaspora rosea]